MSDQFIGEIRLFGFPRIPDGWLACNGTLQSIANFDVLYSLIGTTYGGDGVTTFGIPDLRGRVPLSQGTGLNLTPRVMGQSFGEPTHTLRSTEMPSHSHALLSTTRPGTTATPAQSVHLATSSTSSKPLYAPQAGVSSYNVMAPSSLNQTGNGLPHDNMMPTLTCNYCIAYYGIYPSPG
jgi:microcystin-dependent protein